MQPIKVLSLYLFLISNFSYAEQGVYMLVSGDLTEEQVSAIEETTDYKAIGYFNSTRHRTTDSYPKEEDFEGVEGLSIGYGMERERTNGIKSLSGFATSQLGFDEWGTEETKSLAQSIKEINARAREIHEATKKYGIYAIMRDSGFFQRHDSSKSLETLSPFDIDIEGQGIFFDEQEEETENINPLFQENYAGIYQFMEGEEEVKISTLFGVYALEEDAFQEDKIYFRFSEPIGGGGGGGGSLPGSYKTAKDIIQNHSDYPQRNTLLEWNTNNNSSSVLFVLPSESFSDIDSLNLR